MLAREYGYRVLPGKAIDTQSTARFLQEWRRRAATASKSSGGLVYWGFGGLACVLAYANGFWPVEACLLAVGAWTALCAVLFRAGKRTITAPVAQAESLLTQAPWQVWPCRVEGDEWLSGTYLCRISLLAPDRQVARAFQGYVPEGAWRAMTDGLGLLLVCGDLRHTVAIATEAGEPVWLAKPVPVPDRSIGSTGEQPGMVENLIFQAMGNAASGWLNDNL
ncbi:hypothetical protein LUX01_04150 [Streptomyces sudanensis]|uniref:hypothetical protein n=1 Tax=Streptomyces sudanensis TaxID=436397 RepID=UPI0020CB816C|nr:hypothetical protein [Streptomyces sudanensis]MCP9986020.1 hypothetical protein [Streptomyces sudanensis]